VSTLISDIRHGARVLLRTPVFAVSTILVLALGIGATTAVFGVLNALLFAPLPYAEADRLVMVWEHNIPRNRPRNVINAGNFLAWQERNTSFDEMAIFTPLTANLTGLGDPEELRDVVASASFLRLLGARPILGRVFDPGEDEPGREGVVVIGEGLWRQRMGAQPDAVGRTITLNNRPFTVVGVLPASFELLGLRVDVWRPLVLDADDRDFSGRGFLSLARLKPGVTRDRAQEEMAVIAAQLTKEQPVFNAGWTVNVVPLRAQLTDDVRPMLLVLFAAVVAVLLIACANLISLLLARATARHHELALRAALGAGTSRLVRQLLTETALLVGAGGALGLVFARGLQELFVRTATAQSPMPLLGQVRMDAVVILFALATTVVTALLCGLWPALTARRPSLTATLREGGRGISSGRHGHARAILVAVEVAAAVILLANAGLLVRSVLALQQVDPGFDPSRVLSMRVIRPVRSDETTARAVDFHARAIERLRQVPGVQSAAGTVFLPLAGVGSATTFWLEDRPQPEPANRPVAEIRPVTPRYFQTIGIPLLLGRDAAESDQADRPLVTVVNETFVRTFYTGDNPLGKRVTYSWDKPTTVEIVGVVGDVKLTSLDGQVRPTMYLPHAQRAMVMMSYVLRTASDPAALAPSAVAALRELDPNQPIANVRPLADVVSRSLSRPRVTSTAIAAFALIAVLLAIIGVYGVVAYSVTQRLPEFGVRLALGAQPGDVLRMVLRQGMTMVTIGVIIGIALAVPSSAALRSQLFGIGPGDPLTLAGAALLLIAVALLACYVPARRGAVVDPMQTLRAE
jgi:putative ABC transport system permease protein